MTTGRLLVREMRLEEVGLRIAYFHEASDEHLRTLGVERRLLPEPQAWFAFHEEDYRRPLRERVNFLLLWALDGRSVGFSTLDRIAFGHEAFMHLHVVDPSLRRQGLGTEFVRRSVAVYFDVFELERLYCEPNAFNVAPNRTVQRAGFEYLFTHEATPTPINFPQVTTRWVLDRRASGAPGGGVPPPSSAPRPPGA